MNNTMKVLLLSKYGTQMVQDPEFNVPAEWTSENALWWTVSGGKANYLNVATAYLRPADGYTVPLIAGKQYELRYTVVDATEGVNAARVALYNQAGSEAFVAYVDHTTNGEKVYTFRPVADASNVRLYGRVGAGTFSIENISIRKKAG